MSDEQQAEAEQVDEEVESGIQDGDFVRLAYTVRTIEDGDVVDTTDKEVAEEAEIDVEGYEFEPRVVIVGAGHVFPEVDEALIGAEAGDEDTVEIPAVDAFGEYDEDEVRTVSANKIDEDDRYPGAQVTIDGDQGRLETIIGGRARVNFNHPLAGEDLEYEYEVLELVDDREEQASGLLGMYLQQAPEVWIQTDEVEEEQVVESDDDDEDAEPETETVTVEKDTLYIEATPQMTMNQQWMFSKQQIAQDIMQRLDIDRVIVQETIEGGLGGMGGMMGGAGGADIEEAIEDVDIDADELAAELDADEE
ncbi:FKBP-type peptidyl-prolyl cis-trans isomerase [Haloferax volcanii]|uniref:Peptidyl-prolyl cis-trans isomerase n=3 Tax=Haloferax volcanii TaxID=2246 RepID=D4GZ66_HALVD|nr:peptidylprolyl isomerase [Haloferax volcanii]ADE02464.1 FKBP-type peptidylprolyl isomerase [Haloferax volcanii DS2]ELY35650.1 FKBP-type peptidylprolyl isomerase [Haloferax volcanii DS2]MBS8119433.1 peptidylprolyl isomerase [Haloferax volcanii]MBS8124446.1 peptidylprolyl isomerase [Haloferax volcanii]MBS8128315.1 peptidylprolyl isomerase [Haloferax volcanii]